MPDRFCAYGSDVPADMTESCIGSIKLEARDPENGEIRYMTAPVYSITGFDPNQIIAVRFDEGGGYYLYTELYCDATVLDSFMAEYYRH